MNAVSHLIFVEVALVSTLQEALSVNALRAMKVDLWWWKTVWVSAGVFVQFFSSFKFSTYVGLRILTIGVQQFYIYIFIYYATLRYTTGFPNPWAAVHYQTFSHLELSCGSSWWVHECASPLARAEGECVHSCSINESGGYKCPPLAQMELRAYPPPTQTHSLSPHPRWATKLERLGNSLCYVILLYCTVLYCAILHYTMFCDEKIYKISIRHTCILILIAI